MGHFLFRFLRISFLVFLFTACVNSTSLPIETLAPSKTIQPTQTPVPSETPIPHIVLVAPEHPGNAAESLARNAVEAFARDHSLQLKRLPPEESLVQSAVLENPFLLVSVGSGLSPFLERLAEENIQLRVVEVEEKGAHPGSNLLVIGGEHVRFEEAGFLAGLLAGLDNNNTRIGWVGESGTVRGLLFRNGFLHGVRYACPISMTDANISNCLVTNRELPAGASAEDGRSAAQDLLAAYVDTASAIPGNAGDAAVLLLSQSRVRVAGTIPGFYDALFSGGSVAGSANVLGEPAYRPDVLLQTYLPQFLAGESYVEPIPYSLENGGLVFGPFVNGWISVGRQDYLNDILKDILTGRLSIGVDPATGEEL